MGRNPDLVLQSRVKNYRPALLDELLYEDRALWDGWDKVASIYLAADWPFFERQRAQMRRHFGDPDDPAMAVAPAVRQAIEQRGPLSSTDFKFDGHIDWTWGQPTRLSRAALEALYARGEIGVNHRIGARRAFNLIERLLPRRVLEQPDPNPTDEQYHDWHVLRRIGGIGLAHPGASDFWLGIRGVKARERRAALRRLVEEGEAIAVDIDGVPGQTFFIRQTDLSRLEGVSKRSGPRPQAALIAPLDNLIWDRNLARWIFNFDYTWEVYKPARQRKYGYYVLPVLYGDRFIARTELAQDREAARLVITGWWWEAGVTPNDRMEFALRRCLQDFVKTLGMETVALADRLKAEARLRWIRS